MATAAKTIETVGDLLEILNKSPKDAKLNVTVSDGVNSAGAVVRGGWNESGGKGAVLVDNSAGAGGYLILELELDQKWGARSLQ